MHVFIAKFVLLTYCFHKLQGKELPPWISVTCKSKKQSREKVLVGTQRKRIMDNLLVIGSSRYWIKLSVSQFKEPLAVICIMTTVYGKEVFKHSLHITSQHLRRC